MSLFLRLSPKAYNELNYSSYEHLVTNMTIDELVEEFTVRWIPDGMEWMYQERDVDFMINALLNDFELEVA